MRLCVASPQYAMPANAIDTPTMPETSSETVEMMASSFCLSCLKSIALGTMENEAARKHRL